MNIGSLAGQGRLMPVQKTLLDLLEDYIEKFYKIAMHSKDRELIDLAE